MIIVKSRTSEIILYRLLFPLSFIGQFVHPLEATVWGKGKEGVVILARYKFHFIRVHSNLV